MSTRGDQELSRLRGSAARRFWAAVLIGAPGVFFVLTGFGMIAFPTDKGTRSAGVAVLVIFAIIAVLPAFLLWRSHRARKRHAVRLEQLAAVSRMRSRLPMHELASELGLLPQTLQELLLQAVALEMVSGRIDLEQGVFISAGANAGVGEWAGLCPACRANVKIVRAPGVALVCPYCTRSLEQGAVA